MSHSTKCSNCSASLNVEFSVIQTYLTKDKSSCVQAEGHFDQNGELVIDVPADFNGVIYELNEDSNSCAECDAVIPKPLTIAEALKMAENSQYKKAEISARIAPWNNIAGMVVGQEVFVRYWRHVVSASGLTLPVFYITPSANIDQDMADGKFAAVLGGVSGALDNFTA